MTITVITRTVESYRALLRYGLTLRRYVPSALWETATLSLLTVDYRIYRRKVGCLALVGCDHYAVTASHGFSMLSPEDDYAGVKIL